MSAMMRQRGPSPRSLQAQGLGKVTILVPEDCAESIRPFARELCAQHQSEPTPRRLEWRVLSPSAELMVIPERSARCAVRDTGAPGADRFLWTVAVLEQLNPVAEGQGRGALARRNGGSSLLPGAVGRGSVGDD
jgi:hypothetical protein